MAAFDLNIATLGNVPLEWLPQIPLQVPSPEGSLRSLEEVFFSASAQKINLFPDYRMLTEGTLTSQSHVGARDLQNRLRGMTGNPPGHWPVPRLGLIYAPYYAGSDYLYGIIFDDGQSQSSSPAEDKEFNSSPREGCAVFLGQIAAAGLNAADYTRQVAFTTVHELAHLFNLQHLSSPLCFLNTSESIGPPPDGAFQFLPKPHTALLERVDFDPFVAPGGSNFLPNGVSDNADQPAAGPNRSPAPLRIEAEIAPHEFWPWEPVELDIRLTAINRPEAKRCLVPNRLDAGFECFEIWIEEESGERRRYRPPRRYCAFPSSISLMPGEVWTRDISVFREAGGYTFRRTGLHRIWVSFKLSPEVTIRSEPCEIMIRSWLAEDSRDRSRLRELESLLRHGCRLLYHRSGSANKREIAALKKLMSSHNQEHAGGSALYALARYRTSQALRTKRSAFRKEARELLDRAAQHDAISAHRRENAEKAICQLSSI